MAWSSKEVRRQLVERRVQLSPSLKRGGGVGAYTRILPHRKRCVIVIEIFRDFKFFLLQYASLLFKTLALQLTQKSHNTLRKSTNVNTLVSSLVRPKIAKQSRFSTENIRIVFEITARRRQVKNRDDTNKLSERDHYKSYTPFVDWPRRTHQPS